MSDDISDDTGPNALDHRLFSKHALGIDLDCQLDRATAFLHALTACWQGSIIGFMVDKTAGVEEYNALESTVINCSASQAQQRKPRRSATPVSLRSSATMSMSCAESRMMLCVYLFSNRYRLARRGTEIGSVQSKQGDADAFFRDLLC